MKTNEDSDSMETNDEEETTPCDICYHRAVCGAYAYGQICDNYEEDKEDELKPIE
jgi:hypothetical protein